MTNVDLVRLAGSRARLSELRASIPSPPRSCGAAWRRCASRWRSTSRARRPRRSSTSRTSATRPCSTRRAGSPRCRSASRSSCSRRRCRCASRSSSSASTEFREGDVFVANDPYHGGGHLPDYNVFAPVFADAPDGTGGRRMVLIASIQCHHGDTGGGVPGGYNITANDIWGEGVRWPVVKVIDRGVERRDVLYALQANNRIPSYIGDLRADRLRAARRARLAEIIDRYGAETVEGSVDSMIDYAARRFREEVAQWPDGEYEADAYVDHDPLGNPDVHLHVKVTVAGDSLTHRLHRLRLAPRAPGVVDLRQHARLHGRPDRVDDGPRDPEERRVLRADQAHRAQGLRAQPRPEQAGERGNAPPRRRRGRSDRGRDAARAARARGAADLQDRHPDDHHRRRSPYRRVVHRPLGRGLRGLVQRVEGHGRVGRAQRQLRQPLEGDRRDQRVALPAHPVEPRLPHRLRRSRRVARHLRQPLREGSARRREGLHVRGRHEVPDAGHLRRHATARPTR